MATLTRSLLASVAVLAAVSAEAGTPAIIPGPDVYRLSPLQVGASLLELVQLPTVRRELELDPEQAAVMTALAREFPLNRVRRIPAADQSEALPGELDQTQVRIARRIRQALSYRQWTRLSQIRLQSLGVGVLFVPEVELSLAIAPHQRLSARRIVTRARSHTQALLAEHGDEKAAGNLPPDVLEDLRRTWDDALEQGLELLTEEQRLILSDLLGDHFDF